MSNLEIKHIKNIYLMSNSIEPAPPLGTILGNMGVNTVKFCEEFNIKTKDLPKYFVVNTKIYIYENRSFTFEVFKPTSSFFFNLLKFERKFLIKVHDRYHEKIVNCVTLNDLIQVALFKFPKKNIEESIKILWGSIKSMNLTVVYN